MTKVTYFVLFGMYDLKTIIKIRDSFHLLITIYIYIEKIDHNNQEFANLMTNQNGIWRWIRKTSIVLLAFFLFGCSSSPEGKTVQPVSAQAIAAGNVDHGRDLFMGYAHFQNDGPPCMGCHSVGENGLLGGGAMGPNLTNVSSKRSQVDLASILSNNGWTISPVMEPIFTEHPLTENEQADLIAFLNASVGEPETDREFIVIGISLAGFVAAVVVLGFLYRNRLRGVRKALIKKAQAEK